MTKAPEDTGRPTVGFQTHDHRICVLTALDHAERHCAHTGQRLTPTRRRVLEILLEGHSALGAYDVLRRMREEGIGAQPPAAYRALDFLVSNAFVHRVERLNGFVACAHPGVAHAPAFLICASCGTVAETMLCEDDQLLRVEADQCGFQLSDVRVEALGLCPDCANRADMDPAEDLG